MASLTSDQTFSQNRRQYIISISIIGAFFFIFGFVTWLNGILIPYLKIACELTDFQALFVAFAFYISYTVMALPSSWVLKKTGFKNGMMTGLWVMAAGSLVFIPAALTRTYGIFLGGLFIMGTGLAILQTASNPYITILGPRETAARRISIMGICNKVAGAIAPLVLAFFIFDDGDAFIERLEGMNDLARQLALDDLAQRVIGPYLVMAVVLFLLGLLIRFAPLPEIEAENGDEELKEGETRPSSVFQFPWLILGAVALFFYVGVEVIAGDTIIRYGLSAGMPIQSAKYYTSLVLIAMVIGYVIGIVLIPKVISQRGLLAVSALSGFFFTILAIFTPESLQFSFAFIDLMTLKQIELTLPYSVLFVALLGISNAIVWPAIWPLAIHNLGEFIKTGSAILIMAIAGGAILPLVWGYVSDIAGSQQAYWVAVPCYLFILYYALAGYKVKRWS